VTPQANTVAMPSGTATAAQPVSSGTRSPQDRPISAADVKDPAAPDAAVAAAPAPVSALADANDLYTEAVKVALIDAMLKHSFSLRLGDEEWLTVAARDGEGPVVPGQIDDASTIVIRIKGSDLTAFVTGKLTRDEVMKKVQVREF
jgi:hypothetical protein